MQTQANFDVVPVSIFLSRFHAACKVELTRQDVAPSSLISCFSFYNYSAGNRAGTLLTETQQSDKE